jgi:hypothetical protein
MPRTFLAQRIKNDLREATTHIEAAIERLTLYSATRHMSEAIEPYHGLLPVLIEVRGRLDQAWTKELSQQWLQEDRAASLEEA